MQKLAEYKRRVFLKDHPPVTAQALIGSTGAEYTLLAGTVLGVKDGKHAVHTSETQASCVLAEDIIVPAAGDKYATVYVHAAVVDPELIWEESVSAEQQKSAREALRLKGIYISEA